MTEPIVVSRKRYAFTFVALMLLLATTFGLAHVNLGDFGVAVALLIAATKAMLVVLYFMHIRYSSGVHRLAAGVGVFWLGILVVLALTDYISRNWLLLPYPWPQLEQIMRWR